MSKLIIKRTDLKKKIRTKLHDLYCEAAGYDVDLENFELIIESNVYPVCGYCNNYDSGNCLVDCDKADLKRTDTCDEFTSSSDNNPKITCRIEL
jgi:hypothetical protein